MKTTTKIAKENVARINKALLFIEQKLEQKLVLEDVAKEASFSPFHFHRLFSVVLGETLSSYINRKRIEKAAIYLMNRRELSITEIAESIGFSSISVFSRAFKKFYGISAKEFRELSPEKYSKISKTKSKNGQIEISFEQYISSIKNALNWLQMNATTQVKNVENYSLAYMSHVGNMYHIGSTVNSLIQWGIPKGLVNESTKIIIIYHDSPKISDPNNLRLSACFVLENPIKPEGEVGNRTLNAGKCIVSRFEIRPQDFQQAWESNFVWMKENGYQRADKDPFEIYYNNPEDHPEGKCVVDLCIPIE